MGCRDTFATETPRLASPNHFVPLDARWPGALGKNEAANVIAAVSISHQLMCDELDARKSTGSSGQGSA